MKTEKKKRLEEAGFRIGSAEDFLGLTAGERAVVGLRLALAVEVRKRRMERRFSQAELARRIGSSQSRVAKLEAAEPDVSLELLIRALLATGAKMRDLGKVVAAG